MSSGTTKIILTKRSAAAKDGIVYCQRQKSGDEAGFKVKWVFVIKDATAFEMAFPEDVHFVSAVYELYHGVHSVPTTKQI
jgi:hypothetical protein